MSTRTLALLLRQAANGVYRSQLPDLARAELVTMHHLVTGAAPARVSAVTEGRLEMLEVDLDEDVLAGPFGHALHELSFVHGVFEVEDGDDGRRRYLPRAGGGLEQFPGDLVSIQRYAGKTNELWSHLGVLVAVAQARGLADGVWDGSAPVSLLDPMCGRGTTLNRALTFGWDVAGIEVDRTSFHDHATFLKQYLQQHRVKHDFNRHRLKPAGERLDVTVNSGVDRAELRRAATVTVVQGNAADARRWFTAGRFDAAYCDLPYGVQHRGKGRSGEKDLEVVVRETVAALVSVCRPGAGVALSWNANTIGRERMVALLGDAKVTVTDPAMLGDVTFEHIVDRSIRRDLVFGQLA